jgi:predicted lipoprotein with Yx(FWY)xxD motif
MRSKLLAALFVVGLVAVAACGDDSDDDSSDDSTETTEQEAPDTDAEESAGPATVSVAQTDLGEVLVDADGKTLYLYANDQGTTTAVSGALLEAWPPLTVDSAEVVGGTGVDESLLGTAEQADGRLWVTYNGHLLYRFSGDAAPGDTSGQALGGVWYALTPAGEQVA